MTAHTRNIGPIEIGATPRVVGTTVTRLALAELAAGQRAPQCDIVEIRLDLMTPEANDPWWDDVGALQRRGTPVLATCRAEFEGGKAIGDSERLAILKIAQHHCACIDIESRSALCAALCQSAQAAGKPVIVSYHDFEKTPDADTMRSVLEEICDYPAAIPKAATMINSAADISALEALVAIDMGRPKCLIGMGALGVPTRLDLATQGSALAYGFLDASGAPGQIFCGDMVAHFEKTRDV